MSTTLRTWLVTALLAGLVGVGYASLIDGHASVGFVTGVWIGGGVTALELFVIQGQVGTRLRRAPLAVLLLASTLAWLIIISAALRLVPDLMLGAATAAAYSGSSFAQDLGFSFAVALLFNAALRVRALVGPRVLGNFLIGRYHQPLREQRIFLFLDLVDSTGLAERLGDLRTQALIARFFFDIAAPIARHGGETHRYIGDEVVVTWPLIDGPRDARCLLCLVDLWRLCQRLAPRYQAEFGCVPAFRVGLHGGPVVVSEVGDDRREIVYFGDTVNTAARIGAACKTLDAQCLISAPLLQRLALPAGLVTRSLGTQALRGKRDALELIALMPAAATPSPGSPQLETVP